MEAVACAQSSLRSGFLGNPSSRCIGAEQKFLAKPVLLKGPLKNQRARALSKSWGPACRQSSGDLAIKQSQSLFSRSQEKEIGQPGRAIACQAIRETTGKASADGLRFAVVVARFNDFITKLLLEGAKETFRRHGAADEDIEIVWVPGSFELPVVATAMAKSGKFDAVLCIGAVIRGATTHYEAVVNGATSGILSSSAATGVPVIFGVLTCDTMEQAIDRAGGKAGNKGGECAATAVEMAALLRTLREQEVAAPAWH